MQGMRIKSHKNAFGTHDAFARNTQWSPSTPRAFWQGLKPAPTVANVIVLKAKTTKTTKPVKKRKTKTKRK